VKLHDSLPHEDFLNYFKSVTTENKHFNDFQREISNTFVKMKDDCKIDLMHELNKRRDNKEICSAIKSFKNGKKFC
jgi:hypothetical protein